MKQEDFQFEPVSRGRFEKSEPTIVDGEDLDVPTFLRKNFRPRS
jgi:cell division protein FtsZ